jgi:hypothetical protein
MQILSILNSVQKRARKSADFLCVCVQCNYGRREASKWYDLLARSACIPRVTFMIRELAFHVQIPG